MVIEWSFNYLYIYKIKVNRVVMLQVEHDELFSVNSKYDAQFHTFNALRYNNGTFNERRKRNKILNYSMQFTKVY